MRYPAQGDFAPEWLCSFGDETDHIGRDVVVVLRWIHLLAATWKRVPRGCGPVGVDPSRIALAVTLARHEMEHVPT